MRNCHVSHLMKSSGRLLLSIYAYLMCIQPSCSSVHCEVQFIFSVLLSIWLTIWKVKTNGQRLTGISVIIFNMQMYTCLYPLPLPLSAPLSFSLSLSLSFHFLWLYFCPVFISLSFYSFYLINHNCASWIVCQILCHFFIGIQDFQDVLHYWQFFFLFYLISIYHLLLKRNILSSIFFK